MELRNTARGLALSALVLLVFSSCSPPHSPSSPPPRSLESVKDALAAGDYSGLRRALGHDDVYMEHARRFAGRYDPEGWLVCMSAVRREYRLDAAAKAMQAGDRKGLLGALGFGEQQLRADILNAGDSVEARRAGGMNYFERAPRPIGIMDLATLPRMPEGATAMHVTLYGKREGRHIRLEYALRADGAVDLRASRELAATDVPCPEGARVLRDPNHAVDREGAWGNLDLAALSDRHWYGLRLLCLRDDGRLLKLRMGRNGDGWFVVERSDETLMQRLEAGRDDALDRIRRSALVIERTRKRWPRGPHELSEQPREYVDPAAPEGRRGWALYDDNPPRTLELAGDPAAEGYAVRSKHRTKRGLRAITRDGRLTWLD